VAIDFYFFPRRLARPRRCGRAGSMINGELVGHGLIYFAVEIGRYRGIPFDDLLVRVLDFQAGSASIRTDHNLILRRRPQDEDWHGPGEGTVNFESFGK
jgi:hypothetical protein